jgi:hypothetical protein
VVAFARVLLGFDALLATLEPFSTVPVRDLLWEAVMTNVCAPGRGIGWCALRATTGYVLWRLRRERLRGLAVPWWG